MPGSRLRMRAAPSNSWSIAPKMLPCSAMRHLIGHGIVSGSTRLRSHGPRIDDTPRLESRAANAIHAAWPVHDIRTADRAALHARRASRRSTTRATSAIPGSSRTRAAFSRPATAASCGRCGSSPASARPRRPTQRYRQLLAAGGTGLSVAFDLPTLMGRDPDHELSLGEVGKCGVNVDVAGRHGGAVRRHRPRRHHHVDDDQLAGVDDLRDVPGRGRAAGRGLADAVGHDPERHPEGVHRAEGVHLSAAPVDAAGHRRLRVLRRRRCRRWNTISVSGYHIREAGATAAQELAFTLRDGIEYVQYGIDAGLDVDAFAPRISFFFNSHSDFFEEIAKFRAARRIWARVMRDRFKAQRPAVVAAALPRADRRRVADRAAAVQQRRPHRAAGAGGRARRHAVAAHQRARRGAGAADGRSRDAGAAHAADHRPRDRRHRRRRSARRLVLRRAADAATSRTRRWPTSTRSTRMGGMVAAIERGYPQREIAESAYRVPAGGRAQRAGHRRRQRLRRDRGGEPVGTLYIDESAGERQLARLDGAARAARRGRVRKAPRARCRTARRDGANTMPLLLDAVRAYATVGEMCDACARSGASTWRRR